MKKLLIFCFIVTVPVLMFAQQTVTGNVTDEYDTTLPGVTVSVKGTFIGTITDSEGRFTIQASQGNVLEFSFIGYKTTEVPYTGSPSMNVTLETDIIGLDEVVVVGYGTQARSDITGAVVSISEKSLGEVKKVTNIQQMLQGRAAGVDVVSSGNRPGDGVTVLIRGKRSFDAGNEPLYIIDGIPVTSGFNEINPSDVESITVLKDASSTAIYGSRGANGVVVITTKRGKPGPLTVTLNSYLGISEIKNPAKLMNGEEYAEMKRESRRAAGLYDDNDPLADEKLFQPVELEGLALGRTTDWYGLVSQEGVVHNQDLTLSGGNERARYNISLGFLDDVGVIKNQEYTRYNARINHDQKIGDRINVRISLLGSLSERHGESYNPLHGNWFGAKTENPLAVPYDKDGNLLLRTTQEPDQYNPLLELVPGAYINKRNTSRLLGSIYADIEIIEGLKFATNFGPDIISEKLGNFRGEMTIDGGGGNNHANVYHRDYMAYTWENIVSFNKSFADAHRIDFTGLQSMHLEQNETFYSSVSGMPLESMEYYNFGSASLINSVTSGFQKSTLYSYMARINYAYRDRYLLTMTSRVDGSSKFAAGNRWGLFPSAALGWNIHKEDFLADNETLSSLRLRISYGATGNQGIAPYRTHGLVARTEYVFGEQAAYGYRPSSIRNEDLQWETTRTFNAGIDFGLFKGRINGSFEVYKSRTTDLLLPMVLPGSSGFGSVLTNVGEKTNEGIEFSISTYNIIPKSRGGFSWSSDFNIFTNNERIVELAAGKIDDVGNLRFIGNPVDVIFDYERVGIWQLGEEELAQQYSSAVGQIRVKDQNGDGRITADDRVIIGTMEPDFILGMTQRFEYKGFDLAIVANARWGHMIQEPWRAFLLSGRGNHIKVDYWTPDNPVNRYPRPNIGLQQPYFVSTLFNHDGSFIKIRNIDLGYNISSEFLRRIGVQSMRAYINVFNPITISSYIRKYHGDDPEHPTNFSPELRSYMVGWTINF